MSLHYLTVSEAMRSLLGDLMRSDSLKLFRLVGGTSLALQLGHRLSVDIDLFAGGRTELPLTISNALAEQFPGDFILNRMQQHGFSATIRGIKVDVYDWKIPFTDDGIFEDGIRLASTKDIFAYKCEAVLGRRTEKDYVDIAEISKHYTLADLFDCFRKRYPHISKGAVLAILLKPELFERDSSIRYLNGETWEDYVLLLTSKISEFENAIEQASKGKLDEREKYIQSLIEQKRKKQ
ncbi:MAG: hypothetical protein UZ12_BCD005002977 [Bacteroidetes bacterium OLB12]|nr:MAG: hypothetical protein UZ12_BCD005002977 [Bacteroidetes bacterium OLB12]HNR73958.1 nucleotidyl transferase AbiEii/AbiGii toxin family protein [Cyclobacteriaceae bacterium]HNU41884.1 nucleotidyl transferase AbiEii/AbiGii toxin family protein [Cyclobacteriaceae bacterium]